MMRKLLLIVLVIVNVLLLAHLIGTANGPRVARAQPMGLSGNYLMVSGGVLGTNADVVYIVDLEARQLHALTYERSSQRIRQVGSRDLARDLGQATVQAGEPPERTHRPRGRIK